MFQCVEYTTSKINFSL